MTVPEPVAVLERRLAAEHYWLEVHEQGLMKFASTDMDRQLTQWHRQQVADLERLLIEARQLEARKP